MADPNITTRADSRNSGAHTPGPWRACEGNYKKADGETLCICGQIRSNDLVIATVHRATHKSDPLEAEAYTHSLSEFEANARLIAVAPEMYDLLASMKEHGMPDPERIEAVLKRARGE